MRRGAVFSWLAGFLLTGFACAREANDAPPSATFLLLDPSYRTQFETTWETRPFPLYRRAETLERLRAHLQRRGVRAPAGLWRRVLPELPADAALALALGALENYPGDPPVPAREDAAAGFLIRFAAGPASREEALARHFLQLQERILKKIGRYPGIADFRFEARRALVDSLPDLCRRGQDAEPVFDILLRADLPASLRARILAAMGICGFRSPDFVDLVAEDLFRVRDHAQLAAFARTAFSGARGEARARVLSGIKRVLTDAAWRAHPPFPVLSRMDSPLHRKDFPMEVHRDPGTIPRAFARLLADMGESRLASRILHSAFPVERRGEAAREAFDALWETLMEAASDPAQWRAALVQGDDVALRAVALDFAMRECPDFLIAPLRSGGIVMDVGQTEREWLESFRDEALRRALADASRSAELTRRWNRETTEEAQWNATRELWAPFVKVPGEDARDPCAATDPFEGASPREWLRMRLALTLWVCRPAGPGPAWPSTDFLRDRVTAPDFSLPWDVKKEEARRARVAACMQKRMERLQEWESRELDACRDSFDCVWDALVRRGASWPAEALRRALELWRTADASVWADFGGRFARVPPPLAEAVLEWAAPRLSRSVRERIRDDLTTKCREDAGCLPLWLRAIRLANETEVFHE